MKRPGVVVVVRAAFPWIPVVWELVAPERVVRKFEEANFLIIVGFLVGW
jgi:hypothetical protein